MNEIEKARQLDRLGREIEIVPFVKTMPTPSNTYEETVCVAGIALEPARWVRLYPIRFRELERSEQFKKYSTIRVRVQAPRNDRRPESLRIEGSPVVISKPIGDWNRRAEVLASLEIPTLCELRAAVSKKIDSTSLAAIETRGTPRIRTSVNAGWSPQQQAAIDKWANQDLFGRIPRLLEPPAYAAHLEFDCLADGCKGHSIGLIDWELVALQRRFEGSSVEYANEQFSRKFIDEKFKKGKKTLVLVGNQARPAHRKSFLALGIFGPFDEIQPGLF